LNVRFEEQAVAQIRAAHAWWQANRLAAPSLFADEIANVVARLRADELAGTPYHSRSVHGVRRVLCPRTRYHVYYVIDEDLEAAVILAVWGGMRGRGPSLKRT
jgi:plasmid stabilization system protein ParE